MGLIYSLVLFLSLFLNVSQSFGATTKLGTQNASIDCVLVQMDSSATSSEPQPIFSIATSSSVTYPRGRIVFSVGTSGGSILVKVNEDSAAATGDTVFSIKQGIVDFDKTVTDTLLATVHISFADANSVLIPAALYAPSGTDGYVLTSDGNGRLALEAIPSSTDTDSTLSAPDGSPNPAVRVSNAGYLGVGASDPSFDLHVVSSRTGQYMARITNSSSSTDVFGLLLDFNNSTPDNNTAIFHYYGDATTSRHIVYSDGDVVNHDNSYGAISDSTQKDSIQLVSARSTLDKVKAINPKRYKRRGEQGKEREVGIMAQDLLPYFPELVARRPKIVRDLAGNLHNSETDSVYTVNYMGLVPYLWSAVNRLSDEVDSLKSIQPR